MVTILQKGLQTIITSGLGFEDPEEDLRTRK